MISGSTPQSCRWLIDDDTDGMAEASLFHDYIYAVDIKPRWYTTKASADKLFYNLLRYYGMGYFKAQTAYIAVKFLEKVTLSNINSFLLSLSPEFGYILV